MFELGNLLSTLQSSIVTRQRTAKVRYTKFNKEVLKLLYMEGFITGFGKTYNDNNDGEFNYLTVFLKYDSDNNSFVKHLKIISTPSKRIFVSYENLVRNLSKNGLFVISTSKYGLIFSDFYFKSSNKVYKSGGELLFQIFV